MNFTIAPSDKNSSKYFKFLIRIIKIVSEDKILFKIICDYYSLNFSITKSHSSKYLYEALRILSNSWFMELNI